MLAEIRRQSVVKQILLLAGVGVTAFWLGSRVLSVPKNNAALRPADAGHVVAVDSRVETQAGIPRPFSPPRIDPAEPDSASATPVLLPAAAASVSALQAAPRLSRRHKTASTHRRHKRSFPSASPPNRAHDPVPNDNEVPVDEPAVDSNGEPVGGYDDPPKGKGD